MSAYTQTLGHLLLTYRLFAGCPSCRRAAELDLPMLVKRFGADAPIEAVRERVRCRACGKRTNDVRVVRVGGRGRDKERH
jgi:hypothetical protein